jgi:hypothetical protein
LTVEFRAYNEGAAYRLETALPQAQVHVCNEEAIFHFTADDIVYYPSEESFFSHNERKYLPQTISQIAPASLATLPAVVDPGDGVKVAIGIGPGGLSGPLAARHQRSRACRHLSTIPIETATGKRPGLQSGGKRRLHRGHPRYAHFSMAGNRNRRKRRRSAYEPIGVVAGKTLSGRRYFVDQARQSGVGLVECEQCLRC